jgi:hypothetical protein
MFGEPSLDVDEWRPRTFPRPRDALLLPGGAGGGGERRGQGQPVRAPAESGAGAGGELKMTGLNLRKLGRPL